MLKVYLYNNQILFSQRYYGKGLTLQMLFDLLEDFFVFFLYKINQHSVFSHINGNDDLKLLGLDGLRNPQCLHKTDKTYSFF